ncbi:conserved hypothetical protein [Ricinus communis]|uniref:Uncharacterized protein n=1 Tax=Ricinus communis TaxID=3988 RepID=B9TFK6_RICCO|nr:conserved hypothetical protein [Ricinus communis]
MQRSPLPSCKGNAIYSKKIVDVVEKEEGELEEKDNDVIGKSSGYRTEGVSNFKNMLIQVSNFKNRALCFLYSTSTKIR